MRRFLRARLGNDRGIALPMVIGVTTVLLLLASVAVTYSVGGLKEAKSTEDWSAALAAAYAGVEEYQSRIAEDTTYMQYGNTASTFSTGSTLTLPTNPVNPAFGVGANGTWATVVGSNDDGTGNTAYFRYEVNTAQYASTGSIRVRSTGRVGQETRSIVADLRQQGFIDFLWFTKYEIQDIVYSGKAATCAKYAWQSRASDCSNISFVAGDTLHGPVHSNDTMRACGATFEGTVTTANPGTPKVVAQDSNGNSCTASTFQLAGYPAFSPEVGMPSTNGQLKRETRSDLTANGVPRPGCLYTGPTKITFNSNGTITVRSPWTIKTRTAGDPASSGTTPAECGTVGTSAGQLGNAAGATFALPANNVIYVQPVPTSTTDPNYRSATAKPGGTFSCTGADGTTAGNGLGYPTWTTATPHVMEAPPYTSGALTSYGCRSGDLFVDGTLDGRATLAADNYVYITGDINYKDLQDDMLGIVGNNAIWIWNPMTAAGVSILNNTNRRVDSALLSVAHTFQVQNYDKGGSRGTLTVNGSIAQYFRGIVRNGTNGYIKNYLYDKRLRYMAPPKYLSPVTTTYGVSVWVEISPVFNAKGVYR